MIAHLPYLKAKSRKHNRKYLLILLSNLKPHYIKMLVNIPNAERVKTTGLPKNTKPIKITPEYADLIAYTTFCSSKY